VTTAHPRAARGGQHQEQALAVVVDGEPMPAEEARAFWGRFSAYMEEHKGDLGGFAKQEGFASVHPAMRDGKAILLASRTSAQRPYAPVDRGQAQGGSSHHQGTPRDPAKGGGRRGKGPKRRA
jgi:hypothetical protein